MGNKTFQDRVIEEFKEFQAVYSRNLAAWKAQLRAFDSNSEKDRVISHRDDVDEAIRPEPGNDAPNEWEWAFDIGFEKALKPLPLKVRSGKEKKKRRRSRPSSGFDAIIESVQDLDLDELQLGSTESDDLRVGSALALGLLEENQLAPLYSLSEHEQRSMGMGPVVRKKFDSRDPIFWRTLLEMFCRAYMSSSGRPPWTLSRKVELALDVYDIVARDERLRDVKMIIKDLQKLKPESYTPDQPNASRSAVGEDTVQEVLNWLRPMDDGDPLDRLEERFPIELREAMNRRAKLASQPSLEEIKEKLEQAGKWRKELIEKYGLERATKLLNRSNRL